MGQQVARVSVREEMVRREEQAIVYPCGQMPGEKNWEVAAQPEGRQDAGAVPSSI